MDILCKLTPKAPLMLGGRDTSLVFKQSLPFISGAVMRAAIARLIALKCSVRPANGHLNWVEFKGESQCSECSCAHLCSDFSSVRFEMLYPENTRPMPMTARQCKYQCTKAILDVMLTDSDTEELDTCPRCQSPLEHVGGLYRIENDAPIQVEPIYQVISRTAIDPYRHTAQDSLLHTVHALSPLIVTHGLDGKTQPEKLVLSGHIRTKSKDTTDELIRLIGNSVRIGADTTAGFGLCEVSCMTDSTAIDTEEALKKRIESFPGYAVGTRMLPITLRTDMLSKLSAKQTLAAEQSTTAFLDSLYNCVNESGYLAGVRIIRAYAAHSAWRGFDTSKQKDILKPMLTRTLAGTVFLLKVENELNVRALLQLEKNGIGLQTENGYGQIRVADEFHLSALKEGGVYHG